MVGQTISHYRIISELGRGGMGVVYKAEDTKLDRVVALKLLAAHMLGNDSDRARFFREARAAAALHHPNIATVFEIDEQGDQPFIAMEFVDGQPLDSRIREGPLSLDEATRVTRQIAEALKLAHDKHIVHRDIKSGNVMLTADGTAKILDFGLAKTLASTKLTQVGSTLGTVSYMSPEQTRGQEVDGRSDIWSLGVVLYEMVSGRLPFSGDYEQAVIYSILNDDPEPLTAIRTGVPMELEWVVNKCLAKDPALRYQSAGELPADLKVVNLGRSRTSSSTNQVSPAISRRGRSIPNWIYGVAGVLLGALTAGLLLRGSGPSTDDSEHLVPTTKRFTLKLPENAPLATLGSAPLGSGVTALTISGDGSSVVYAAHSDATTILYHVALQTGRVQPLEGTQGAYSPFFSLDGQWVAYFADFQLKKVSLDGGSPVTLCEARNPQGGAWISPSEIVFANDQGVNLEVVSASGGTPRSVSGGDQRVVGGMPYALPNGDLLFQKGGGGVWKTGLGDAREVRLVANAANPRYVSSGHLVYATPGRLFVQPLDYETGMLGATRVPVLDGLRTEVFGAAQFAISDEGTLVYVAGQSALLGRLVWVSRDGSEEFLPFEPDFMGTFRISPSGDRILQIIQGTNDLWVYDIGRQTRTRFQRGVRGAGLWSHDGRSILYAEMNEAGDKTFIRRRPVAGGAVTTVHEIPQGMRLNDMAPDGNRVLVHQFAGAEAGGVHMIQTDDSSDEMITVASSDARVWGGTFSPSGRHVAYSSLESGRSEVWVTDLDGSGAKWQISTSGGEEPVWSLVSDELFFSNGTKWYRVTYRLTPTPTFDAPELMFEGSYMQIRGFGYDVTPDGKRFLLVKPVEEGPRPTELNVVVNWFEEIKTKVDH
jgi:serine/threonine protein kinase/Tol biopolymer transport system component